jgi:hypothetical protein
MLSKEPNYNDYIDEATRSAEYNLKKGHDRLNNDRAQGVGMHITSKGSVTCRDVSCPICRKGATEVVSTTVYHKPGSHEDKIKEIQMRKEIEDFKHIVVKDSLNFQKGVKKDLDLHNDEIIRVNRRVDSVVNKVNQGASGDFDGFKNYVEK